MQVVPTGAHRCVEFDGANHTAGDLTAGEIRPVKAVPCLRVTGQWGRLTRWVLRGSLSGCTAPGAPSNCVG